MEKLVANLSSKITTKRLLGKEYLVAPVAMLVEGVLAGNIGPVLYEEDEILRSVEAWNNKPITIGHPENLDGTKASACTPETLERHAVGIILNTKYDKRTKKLKAEAWFDKERLDIVPDAMQVKLALNSGKKMEVSTGLYVDVVRTAGDWNGKPYVGKTTGYRPDHLAILPYDRGACSIEDGAGLLVNKEVTDEEKEELRKEFKDRAEGKVESYKIATFDQLREIAKEIEKETLEIGSEWPQGHVVDIFDDSLIFASNSEEGKYFKENFAKDGETVKLLGNLIEVSRKVSYEPLVTNEKQQMDREELLKHLGDEHKDFVTNMTDAQVGALLKLKAEAPAAPEQPAPQPVVNSLEDILALAPAKDRAVVEQALATNQKVREDLIAKIVANKANAFSADELGAFDTPALEKMAALAFAANAAQPDPIYAGSPGSAPEQPAQPLKLPSTL